MELNYSGASNSHTTTNQDSVPFSWHPVSRLPSLLGILISLLVDFRPAVVLLHTEKGMRFICIATLDESGQHRIAPAKDHLTDVVQAVLHELC